MMELRNYQKEAIKALWEWFRTNSHAPGWPLLVCPTGSGKSLIIADIVRAIREKRPDFRVLIVTHRKEIIQQNVQELRNLIPDIIPGVWSAGLGSKIFRQITFAGIQSIYKKAREISPIDLLIVDECHLIPKNSDSMYRQFIDGLRSFHNTRVIGLTATPFRLDQGSIVEERGLFCDIAYEIGIKRLIHEKFLSPVISKQPVTVDLSTLKTSGHDYTIESMVATYDPLVVEHAKEIVRLAGERKHWLVFCSGITHAAHISEALNALGIAADYVTGEMCDWERDLKLKKFSTGEIKALCNCQILTTGFNFKPIDLLVLLRPTKSAALYIQMIGRGMRTAEGKQDCLVLDFGNNIERHGPIDCIEIKRTKGKVKIGIQPTKKCPQCEAVVSIRVATCPGCGYEFPRSTMLEKKASELEILSTEKMLEVDEWNVKVHKKEGKPDSFRIEYKCGLRYVNEFLCFAHGGFAAHKAAQKWLRSGGKMPIPHDADEAMRRNGELLRPDKLWIRDGKYPEVLRISFFEPDLFEPGDLNI